MQSCALRWAGAVAFAVSMLALVMARLQSKTAQGANQKLSLPKKVISILFFPKCELMHSVMGDGCANAGFNLVITHRSP